MAGKHGEVCWGTASNKLAFHNKRCLEAGGGIANSIYEERNLPHNACYHPGKTYDPKQCPTATGPATGHLRLIPPGDKNIESSEWSDFGRDPRFGAGWWIIPGLIWAPILIVLLIART